MQSFHEKNYFATFKIFKSSSHFIITKKPHQPINADGDKEKIKEDYLFTINYKVSGKYHTIFNVSSIKSDVLPRFQ